VKRIVFRRPGPMDLIYLALALLSGVLLVLAFPKYDLRFLAPFTLAPLLVASAQAESAPRRFGFGWAAAIVYWFGVCNWIQFVLEVHGGMEKWAAWGAFLLFCVLKALHLATFSILAGPLMYRWYALPSIAALWVGLERTNGTFGFAWLALGNAGIDMSIPLRLAPFVGVYGVSFVLAMLSAALAVVALRQRRRYLMPLLSLPLLLLLPAVPSRIPAQERALVVQPNVDPETQWTFASRLDLEKRLFALSDSLPAHLVVWPELPAPLYYYEDQDFHDAADQLARRQHFFLFGTVAYTDHHEPLNSAVLLGSDGNPVGRYDKNFLVPFGEFIPPAFSWVTRITHEIGDFVPGHDSNVLLAGPDHLGIFICYESAFPHLVRQFPLHGADVLLNLSNDGYFGHSAAREQHLSLVRMRAVENRRFIVRSTNDGITAAIDPAGRVLKRLPAYTLVAAMMPYSRVSETTFYTRHGDWFAWGCLAIGLAASLQTHLATRKAINRAITG
jgi:apolipoprotein N-acyltransferase